LTPRLVAENKFFWALSKPAGQVTIPGRGEVGEALSAQWARETGRRVWVVHRLDREASGLVLFAKSAEAHRYLSGLFETRALEKTYLAVARGRPPVDGVIDRPLKLFGSGRTGVSAAGKPSVTRYRVLENFPEASLVEVHPETGRRHQIRAHFYSLGHPLVGDGRYGTPQSGTRLMLHAWKLALRLPDGAPAALQDDPPSDFTAVLEALRRSGGTAK
jgi:RluA family pseudouridine synthase